MSTYIFVALLSVFFTAPSNGDVTDCEMSSKQIHYHLRNDLLCDYYSDIRPKLEHKNATKIYIRMIVKSFTYDMYTHAIAVNNWLPMTWYDDHLKWDPSNYENIDSIHLSTYDIWTPDLSIYNKHQQDSVHRVFDNSVDCVVKNTGKVTCVPPNKHEALCSADLRKFPYDQQVCRLRFGSWVHAGEEINFFFTKNPVSIEEVPNSDWKLVSVTTEKYDGKYDCCPNDTYPSVSFIFTIKRHASYHEATIVIPALVILGVTLFILCLNVSEIERFYLLMANILFHFLYIQNLSWQLPSVGQNPPNIMIFARDSLILCMVEFIETLILRSLIKKSSENTSWLSGIIGSLVDSRVGQAILVFDNSIKAAAVAKGDEDGANIIEKSQMDSSLDYILFAKLLDRLLCAIYVVIYISMFIRLIL